MSEPAWLFSQEFHSKFQASCSDLTSRLESARSTRNSGQIQALSLELAGLAKSLVDATGSIPSYDQRQNELQLKTLEKAIDELRTSIMPKSKFSFKRKGKETSPRLNPQTSEITSSIVGTFTTPNVLPSTNLALSSQSNSYLTLESLPSPLLSVQSDLTISDLNGCVVNLLPFPNRTFPSDASGDFNVSALHIRNLKNTLLLLPEIKGSVFIQFLSRCTVVVGCHQFRMHNSSNVDVYVSTPSDPIIEHSTQIRFTAYPAALSTSQPTKTLTVQDFSHIRPTPSPNWTILSGDALIDHWPLSKVTDEDLPSLLGKLIP